MILMPFILADYVGLGIEYHMHQMLGIGTNSFLLNRGFQI